MTGNFPTDASVRELCKIGEGAACCRYLTMSPDGWSCEKHSDLAAQLDERVKRETIHARGDNCEGMDSR